MNKKVVSDPICLGVFGGTFDPVHCGHLEIARELRATLGLSAVRFIPAGDPPHRGAPIAPATHRLAMVQLAIAGEPGLEVDAREVRAARRSYTVPTLEELRAEDPERTLALIVGADAFLGLPTWHRWREVFALAHIVVVRRPGVALETALPPELALEWAKRYASDVAALTRASAGAVILQPTTAHPISASAIRERLAAGADGVDAVRGLLPATVLAYIERNQLYRPHQDAP
jgi:nicotinate-nucleotide adenylyltransferase